MEVTEFIYNAPQKKLRNTIYRNFSDSIFQFRDVVVPVTKYFFLILSEKKLASSC